MLRFKNNFAWVVKVLKFVEKNRVDEKTEVKNQVKWKRGFNGKFS